MGIKSLNFKGTEILVAIDNLKQDLFFYYTNERIRSLLTKLFDILESLTKQLQMLNDILESKDEEEILQIHSKYEALKEFILPIQRKAQICWKVLTNCLDYLLKNLLLDLHKTIQYLFKKRGTLSNNNKVNEIQIMVFFLNISINSF